MDNKKRSTLEGAALDRFVWDCVSVGVLTERTLALAAEDR
jgi:hypothetical protein